MEPAEKAELANLGKLVVSGTLPPSTNSLYYSDKKTGTRHLNKKAQAYKRELQWRLKEGGARDKCPPPPYSVHYHFRFPDRRRRDLGNYTKLLEDTVFEIIGHDDSLVNDEHRWRYVCRDDPGFTMEIRHSSREIEV